MAYKAEKESKTRKSCTENASKTLWGGAGSSTHQRRKIQDAFQGLIKITVPSALDMVLRIVSDYFILSASKPCKIDFSPSFI